MAGFSTTSLRARAKLAGSYATTSFFTFVVFFVLFGGAFLLLLVAPFFLLFAAAFFLLFVAAFVLLAALVLLFVAAFFLPFVVLFVEVFLGAFLRAVAAVVDRRPLARTTRSRPSRLAW